jgi:methylglutaconyl-CoA hydratase
MLKLEIGNAVAHVTLDRPDVHNAFNDELIARLSATFEDIRQRQDVRAVVLQANGKSFSAGGDLKWVQQAGTRTHEENLRDARLAAEMFLAVARCPKPVIARVHGTAVGGGAGLVAACDISISVESVEFGFPEVRLGIISAVISPFVIARIGATNAREYFLTGERFKAPVAKTIGLVQHVVGDTVDLDNLVAAKIAQIMKGSPSAIAAAKELIFGVAGRSPESVLDFVSEAFARARASEHGQAGVNAFLSGSQPPWSSP